MTTYDVTPAPKAAKALKKNGLPALLFGLVGVILLLWGSQIFSGKKTSASSDGTDALSVEIPGKTYEVSVEEYRKALEGRIASICTQVTGAEDVYVIVSLEGGFEYVYACDERTGSTGTERTYVTVGSGSSKALVFINERTPAITGIGVVCTGGNDPTVRKEIASLLTSTFGVGSNRVYVTGR